MRRGDLRTTEAIDELQPSDRAALVICAQDNAAEDTVSHDSRNGEVHTVALLIELEGRLLLLKSGRQLRLVAPREQWRVLLEAQRDDADEIVRRDWTDGRLGAAGDAPMFVQNAPLHRSDRISEWDGMSEVEIASGLDHGQVHPGGGRIGNDLLDF